MAEVINGVYFFRKSSGGGASIANVICSTAENTPQGVSWTSGGSTITGTLAASASTISNRYFVLAAKTKTKNTYKEYVTISVDGSYQWEELGTVDLDLDDYLKAPAVAGTAGQVLKKTASGTEWANEQENFVVNVGVELNQSYSGFNVTSCDKSFSEIVTAYNAGRHCIAFFSDSEASMTGQLPLYSISSASIRFNGIWRNHVDSFPPAMQWINGINYVGFHIDVDDNVESRSFVIRKLNPHPSASNVNHLLMLDSGGNVADSGKTAADLQDVIYGYLYNGAFYEDSAHATAITPSTTKQYVDMTTATVPAPYMWNGTSYIGIGGGDTSDIEEVAAAGINDLHETLLDWLNGRSASGKMLFETSIVNNLTSYLENRPLSAYQGLILNSKFADIELIAASALVDLAKAATILGNIAAPYSGAKTYVVGAYATQDGCLWKCDTAVSTPELFDVTKWHTTTVMNELAIMLNLNLE